MLFPFFAAVQICHGLCLALDSSYTHFGTEYANEVGINGTRIHTYACTTRCLLERKKCPPNVFYNKIRHYSIQFVMYSQLSTTIANNKAHIF